MIRQFQLGTLRLGCLLIGLQLLLGVSNSRLVADDELSLGPQSDLAYGLLRGSATISVEKDAFARGEIIKLEVRFNASSPGTVFNPYFASLTVQPAELSLFDSNKRYLGNVLDRHYGSFRGPGPNDWVNIGTGGFVGTKLEFPAGILPDGKLRDGLSPGKYYIQMIFNQCFVSVPPTDPLTFARSGVGDWLAANRKRDIFRSNYLTLEFR